MGSPRFSQTATHPPAVRRSELKNSQKPTIQLKWIMVTVFTLLLQAAYIYYAYTDGVTLEFLDIYPWLISFPECIVVLLFSLRLPFGSRHFWKLFVAAYSIYVAVIFWEILTAYIQLYSLGPIAYTLAGVIICTVKGFNIYAVASYWHDKEIWRWQST